MGKRGVGDYWLFWDMFIPRMFDLLQKRGWEWNFVDFYAHVPHCAFDKPYQYGFDEKRDDLFYEEWMEGDPDTVIKKKWVFRDPLYRGRRTTLWNEFGGYIRPGILKKIIIPLDQLGDICTLNSRENIIHACRLPPTACINVQYISERGIVGEFRAFGDEAMISSIRDEEIIKLVNIYFARSTPSPH